MKDFRFFPILKIYCDKNIYNYSKRELIHLDQNWFVVTPSWIMSILITIDFQNREKNLKSFKHFFKKASSICSYATQLEFSTSTTECSNKKMNHFKMQHLKQTFESMLVFCIVVKNENWNRCKYFCIRSKHSVLLRKKLHCR